MWLKIIKRLRKPPFVRTVLLALTVVTVLVVSLVPTAALAAPAATASTSASFADGTYYIVQPGDTLARIARRFGTTVTAIVHANGIANPSRIFVGQRLFIPGGYGGFPSGSIDYIVQTGDSLSTIARRFNTTVDAIALANGIANPNVVYVGRQLIVPTGSAAPPSVFGFYYTVRPGDALTRIAQRFGVSIGALVAANGIHDPNRIFVGQRLFIP